MAERRRADQFAVGDVVAVAWKDHYRVHNSSADGLMLVESFGRVGEVTDECVVLFQNRITNIAEVQQQAFCANGQHFSPLHECMDGQLIVKDCIVDVRVLERGAANG